jgi:protein involved in polysaccharide export with SLBB domain
MLEARSLESKKREANLRMRRCKFGSSSLLLVLMAAMVFVAGTARGQIGNPLSGADSSLSGGQSGTSSGSDTGDGSGQMQGGRGMPQTSVPRGVNLPNGQDINASGMNGLNGANGIAGQRALNQLPSPPPSEFQRMVATSTGKLLPIYGAGLFRNAPSTFAPADRVPVTPDYVLGPGDELLIQVWGQVTLNSRFTVDRSGNIYVPQVGSMRVAGLQFAQLQDYLKTQMSKVFRNFDLNVNMGQLRSIQIFVVGQARRPGSYTVSSLSTLVNALFVTGGPTPQGSLRHIELKRSDKVVVDFDLYDLLLHGDKSKDVQLLAGDVIYIAPVGPQVAVAGSVNAPAIYELKSNTDSTVDDALALAGGLSTVAADGTMRMERVDEHHMRGVTDFSLDEAGRATKLRDGDILELTAVVNRYKNAVTLRGNVANPGHYVWKPGMRVGDLFPDRDALITRDYWLKRGRLGQPVLTFIPLCPTFRVNVNQGSDASDSGDPQNCIPANAYNEALGQMNPLAATGTNGTYGSNGTNSTYGSNGYNSNNGTNGTNGVYDGGANGTNGMNGAAALNGANGTNSTNGTNGFNGQNDGDLQVPGRSTSGQDSTSSSNGVGGASGSAAAATLGQDNNFQPRNNVRLSEPDIDWSYAVIERQNKESLTTSLLPFNLGRVVMGHDESQNLELQPGDVVTIFSKADIQVPQMQQTRFVRLEGEFVSSGVYSVLPGETLKQLVARAGGLSPDAYLYGSEFTRESTRRLQQQRLNDYINKIALEATMTAATAANSAVSAADTAAATAGQTQNQALIASLRASRASGRIVLNLHPDSNQVAELPALPLEDGDTFLVPHLPSTVSVAGAVYNPNSFLYDEHRRVKDYLRLAGGANRDADRSRAYLIRADGSVISKQQISSLRRDGFDSLRVFPGDSVVVPLNVTKGTNLRSIVDIATIVGQFGLAIAATSIVF